MAKGFKIGTKDRNLHRIKWAEDDYKRELAEKVARAKLLNSTKSTGVKL